MTLSAIRRRLNTNDVAFLYDPEGNVHYWKLRCLPALQFLDFDNYTYPTSWRQLKQTWEYEKGGTQYGFPGYGYHVISNFDHSTDEDLGVVTTSYYEHQTQYSIKHLIDQYTVGDGTLVVVADHREFEPVGGTRPLYQEQFVTRVGTYERLYKSIEEAYNEDGWELPLYDTKNLFVQDNANLYEFIEDETLDTAEELLSVLPEAPYLPMYDTFCAIFSGANTQGSSPLESDDKVEALGGWLRRRIEWSREDSIRIGRELNRAVSEKVSTFDRSYALRSPKRKHAQQRAKELSPESSNVDSKYHDWLVRT